MHEAFELGVEGECVGLTRAQQAGAFRAAQELFEQYLAEHEGSEEISLPPPRMMMH